MLAARCWQSHNSRFMEAVVKGNRPSFDGAAPPERARQLYQYFVERIRAIGLRCETGQFQAMMQVELVNDGPVTILLDSSKAF